MVEGHRIASSHILTLLMTVCESTGAFLMTVNVQPHPKAGAKQVVSSSPAANDSHTIVMGIMEDTKKTKMECVCVLCRLHNQARSSRRSSKYSSSSSSSSAQQHCAVT